MRSALGMVGGWLAVTGLAVGLAVGAVGMVSDSMTADRPRALSASAVEAALGRDTQPRTFHLKGGDIRVLFSPGATVVLAALSAPGYDVAQRSLRGGAVEVRLRSDHHESRLRAWWDGGPRADVDEN